MAFDGDGCGWGGGRLRLSVFDATLPKVLDAVVAAKKAARIERRVSNESGAFGVWVVVETSCSTPVS